MDFFKITFLSLFVMAYSNAIHVKEFHIKNPKYISALIGKYSRTTKVGTSTEVGIRKSVGIGNRQLLISCANAKSRQISR